MTLETLERRAMLAIDATFVGGVLTINYNQPDAGGLVTTTNQNAVIEIDEIDTAPAQTVRVNLYRSSNPNADVYLGVTEIIVNVPNPNALGVSNNSLTIKGLESPEDRIVMVGSGQTMAGRWYDQLPPPDQNQILFEITGIDNLTLTAGGTINVSGSFTNDTADASITVIGTSLETDADRTPFPGQHTGTIVLGENTPEQTPGFPAARLVSNYIHVIGAAIEINSDIYAEGEVSIKASEFTGAPSNLLLPYDITVNANPNGTPGRLDLFAAKSVIQQSTSTIRASLVNVVADNTQNAFGAAVIDLSSHKNDFDELTIRTGTALAASTGSVAIRDCDDLVIANAGLLSTTGSMTIHADGLLTIDTPIFAGSLKAYSGFGILSTDRGTLTIGDGGIDLAAKTVAANATGDITLNGRIEIGDFDLPAVIINNAIRADGLVTIAGGFFSPQAGVTMVEGIEGILIASPVQVGNTFLNATSTAYVVTDADLTLVSSNGFIDILDFSGNSAIPQAVQVTNMLSLDAFGDILIDGLVFAGTRYGDVLDLEETEALPNISIRGQADITIGNTGRLETSSYETNADTHVNPLIGAITITDASQFNNFGRIDADGAIEVSIKGDIYLTGSVTARESIMMETDFGIIDVQGAVRTTGFTYLTVPPAPLLERRTPNISLSAPSGSISTSSLGTLQAGTLAGGLEPIYGEVQLYAQQDISIGADIDTDGGLVAESKLGGFMLDALLRAGNEQPVKIQAAAEISEFEFGRIETSLLDVTIAQGPVAGDITLPALGNRVLALQARNFTPGGSVELFTDSILEVQRVETRGDVSITAAGTISITGLTQSIGGSHTIVSQGGGLNVQSTLLAPEGGITLSATGEIVQRGGNVVTIYLLSGGRDYSFANVILDPPPGAGDVALARAVITPYPRPPIAQGDGIAGFISGIIILNGGWGYPSASRVGVTIDGDGEGATAVAETSIVTSSIEARDDISITAGDGLTLVSAVRSAEGNIEMLATLGDISVQSITAGAGVDVTSGRGEITLVTVSAQDDVVLTADQGVRVNDSMNSFKGDVTISTTNGDLDFNADPLTGPGLESVIYAAAGDVSLTSVNGRIISPYTINAQGDVVLTSFNTLELTNEITSQAGDIRALSTSGRIDITANIVAEAGSVSLEAQTSVRQEAVTGVRYMELLSAGPVLDEPPVVTVTVAPPAAGGGRAATAAAIIERRRIRGVGAGANPDVIEYEYFIQSIVVLDPGRGYAIGEDPLVTVTGVAGVVARAYGPNAVQMVTAQEDITLDAGENVTLVTKWHAVAGDILMTSKTGDFDLSVDSLLLSTAGGSTTVIADAGSAVVQRVASFGDVTIDALQGVTIQDTLYSETGTITVSSKNDAVDVRNLNAGVDVKIDSFMSNRLGGEIAAQTGDILVTSGSGGIFLNANLVSEQGRISLAPQTFLLQQDGTGIEEVQVIDHGGVVLGAETNPPAVLVTIAPPRAPAGEQAQAVAVLANRALGSDDVNERVEWYVESIRIINPGRGYALGELPITTVTGIGDAILQAVGPTNVKDLWAELDIDIAAGDDITLLYNVTSERGNISAASTSGSIDFSATTNLLHAVVGDVSLLTKAAATDANSIKAGGDVTIRGETGVAVRSFIDATGKIDVRSVIGNTTLAGEVYSAAGDIDVESVSGSVSLAANIQAEEGRIDVVAHGGIFQRAASGVQRIEVLFGGESATSAPPNVEVTIAPPRLGGNAAEAFARLRSFTNAAGQIRYTIDSIEITNPGRGYEIGEQPAVAIEGLIGAAAIAVGPSGFQDIVAESDVRIEAGETVVLSNVVRSVTGDIVVSSIDGNLSLGFLGQRLHAESGDVSLRAFTGNIEAHRVYAAANIGVRSEGFISLGEEVVSEAGDILVTSESGSVFLAANIHAVEGNILLKAHHQVRQTSRSGLTRIEVVAGGRLVQAAAPTPQVIIAPPRAGGEAASAVAIVTQAGLAGATPIWSVQTILITSPGTGYAIGESPEVTILGLPGALAVAYGPEGMQSIVAEEDLEIATGDDILLVDNLRSNSGDVTVTSIDGDIDMGTPGQITHAVLGSVVIETNAGGIDVWRAYAGDAITVRGERGISLEKELVADTGDIVVDSISGSIILRANLHAIAGRIDLDAHQQIRQFSQSGITEITIVDGGALLANNEPTVTVTIAPPVNAGGRAATAEAIVRQTGARRDAVTGQDLPIFSVVAIVVLDPGQGYEVGERPLVTITGVTGAIATAEGPRGIEMLVSDLDLTIDAGDEIRLVDTVRSNAGNVRIASIDRDVNLGAPGQLVHTLVGDIEIQSLAGGITFNQLVPGRDLSLESFLPLVVNQPLVIAGGSGSFASTGFNVALNADIIAADQLSLSAKTGITQTNGTIKATDLYAENSTPTAIALGAAGNDVDRFSAFNIGAIAYNDANSFRVGLQTSGPMGVELVGGAVALTATDTIRVVAGVEAGTLQMTADTVELVTTKATDNPNGPFGGTFRDMIEISNANADLTSEHVMLFDEPGYPISEITVARSLPAITRAVTIDGESADGGRLGVRGSAGVATGVWFGEGSTGSSLNDVALYGFSSGSAVVIESGENTVNDLWFGLRADGTAGPANRVGVNVSGDRAFNNLIGSRFVFDPLSANRFAGHTDAAIVVQRGASNNLVAGNLVGGDGLAANRNGIRIDGGSGNRIGTPDQVTPDLRPTESNRIVGNSHYGIEIRNVRGSTTRVENNVVSGNATKVGSGTHGIGVLNSAFVQIGGVSELSRNQVYGSLGGSGIHLSGSNNVRIQGNVIGADGYHLSANGHTNDYDANRPDQGNGMHGIHVFGRSRDVEIDANRIVDNERSGVAIASGSSGVLLTNNEIGVWVHPVTGNVHAAGNDADGVTITAANGNTIGAGNLIGYNGGSGIMVENSVAAGLATGNRLAGAELFGNLGHGIHVSGSSRQTVGGYSGEGNVIKENGLDGIRLENDPRIRASAAPHGNVVAGNFVGTNDNQEIDRNWGNRNGIAVMNGVDNVLAGNVVMNNRASGIEIGGGDGNTVGGQIRSAGNFVGYNFGDGVYIHDQASTQLQVGVIGTTITNQGAGYAASRTSVIFTAPAASGGVPARGVAIVSAAGRVTGIRLTSSGTGYFATTRTASITLGSTAAAVNADGLFVGMTVSGVGIQPDTVVNAIPGPGLVTLSKTATVTNASASLTFAEPVSVQVFDPQASVIATASVTLGEAARRPDGAAAVSEVSRRHVVSGNEIEANNGAGIYVKGDRTTEIQLGQDLNGRAGRGLGNKISFHDVGVLVDAAGRTSLQGNELGDNGMPIDLINGANQRGRSGPVQVVGLASTAWGRSQTRVTGTIVNGGAFHEFWVDVYATPHYDLDEDVNGATFGHEMRTFLGRTLVTTDTNGRAAINLVVSESVGLGDSISLTLTSNRHEDGSTVGVWHSTRRHGIDLSAAPTMGSPTVTPTTPGGSSGGASTPGRAPVAPRG